MTHTCSTYTHGHTHTRTHTRTDTDTHAGVSTAGAGLRVAGGVLGARGGASLERGRPLHCTEVGVRLTHWPWAGSLLALSGRQIDTGGKKTWKHPEETTGIICHLLLAVAHITLQHCPLVAKSIITTISLPFICHWPIAVLPKQQQQNTRFLFCRFCKRIISFFLFFLYQKKKGVIQFKWILWFWNVSVWGMLTTWILSTCLFIFSWCVDLIRFYIYVYIYK